MWLLDSACVMKRTIPEILLWLLVINLGIAFGAGLYEKRIVLPEWFPVSVEGRRFVDGEAMRQTDAGRRFWAYVTTVPLTLLVLTNLLVAWQAQSPRREWWMVAAAITLIERIGTFSYFIPTAITPMQTEGPSGPEVETMATHWIQLDYVRAALSLAGWLAALKALSLSKP
jgi:hypothetical protein